MASDRHLEDTFRRRKEQLPAVSLEGVVLSDSLRTPPSATTKRTTTHASGKFNRQSTKPPTLSWLFPSGDGIGNNPGATSLSSDSVDADEYNTPTKLHRAVSPNADSTLPIGHDQPPPYNYHPFRDKTLIRGSTLANLLQTERAEHCLVFHRVADHLLDFRPDLELDCGDETGHCQPQGGQTILISYSGMDSPTRSFENGLSDTPRRSRIMKGVTKSPKHRDVLRSNGNSIDNSPSHIYSNTKSELARFWDQSPLIDDLDADLLQDLKALVPQELAQLAEMRSELALKVPPELSLRDRCRQRYDTTGES
ncbi:anaphase promoting complex subunit 9 KNAG_0G02210 [Huiozyma naganishii CBS 8797]|uniref:Uncharacterized protein n=1 Tax=Huiozyma naganishii (strain ATCC MYA-139 / BCRC 22969 / CBS 8797 / KCTC 17520 / NBRC 10181 / NCYC 3082 / Yp74L-3) TaxID=1071383 RepID=J7S806_HUIN7|nr:hypothetical protein KNAG_0G02210 [Kazachstania naganishii CBS 8797]CCK71279.1 hypothetical protein KNAG_0G02210 [Kazachstania naganishii CBS 8797]